MKRLAVFFALAFAECFSAQDFEYDESFPEMYVSPAVQVLMPQGGHSMRTLCGGAVRAGRYFSDALALEAEAAWLENCASLSARMLWHLHGWELIDSLFGYERFDPFVAFGVRGWIEGDVGPALSVGGYYYLTNEWALRFDGEAVAGVDGDLQMLYSVSVGLQYSF